MSNNAPDYENDLVFTPKSADDLNEQRRQSDVIISAIEKCKKLEQELKQLKELLRACVHFLEYASAVSSDERNINAIEAMTDKIKDAIGESEE